MKNTSNKNKTSNLSKLQQEAVKAQSALKATLDQIATEKQASCAVLDAHMSTIPSLLGVESFDEAYGLMTAFKKHGTVFPTRKGGKKRIDETVRLALANALRDGKTIKFCRETYHVSNNFILKIKSEAGLQGRIAAPKVEAPAPVETPAA